MCTIEGLRSLNYKMGTGTPGIEGLRTLDRRGHEREASNGRGGSKVRRNRSTWGWVAVFA
jgi:hypothetical protein